MSKCKNCQVLEDEIAQFERIVNKHIDSKKSMHKKNKALMELLDRLKDYKTLMHDPVCLCELCLIVSDYKVLQGEKK